MDFQEPLFDAVAIGDEDAVLALLNLGASVNNGDKDGLTVLHWSSGSNDSANLVPVLIGQGARFEIQDNFGRNALHIHCQFGRANAVACILHHGADPNELTASQVSPLQLAIANRHIEVAKLLLAFGATPISATLPGVELS